MNLQQAIDKAQQVAKKKRETIYVVWERGVEGYQIATDIDLDTHFSGCAPEATVEPNGEISW
jgi:hypothetical protein